MAVARFCMLRLRVRIAMGAFFSPARSMSEESPERLSCSIADMLTIQSDELPGWITNEEGTRSEKEVWEIIARGLESAEPDCVNSIL